jgi:hypothetical protein
LDVRLCLLAVRNLGHEFWSGLVDEDLSLSEAYHQRPPWMRPEDHAHMLEGLRKASWEG